jgi:hypothetical protein
VAVEVEVEAEAEGVEAAVVEAEVAAGSRAVP